MRHWDDQPECIDGVELVATLRMDRGAGAMRVYKANTESWYVTAGNLFGSQTVWCPNVMLVFELLDKLSSLPEGKALAIPKECVLL